MLGVHGREQADSGLGTFASLSVVPYRFLWVSMLCSFGGMQMQMIARGYLAYKIGGTVSSIALTMVGMSIPMLIFPLFGGAVADRFERRRLMIISQLATAAVALSIAILVQTDAINLTYLFIAGMVQGTIFSFAGPARQSFIPEIVPEDKLMNAIALNNAGMNLTRIGGPAIAGTLIGISWFNIQGVFYLQAALNIVALSLLFAMPAVGQRKGAAAGPTSHGVRSSTMMKDLVDGLRYVRSSPILMTLLMMGIMPMLLGSSYQNFLPVFAKDVFGHGSRNASGLGWMSTMTGVGAIVGSLAVASLANFPRRTLLQLIAGLGFGLSTVFFAVQHDFVLALAGLVCLGMTADFFQSLNATLVVSASHPEYYGRVMSLNMMSFALMPFGTVPLGYLADWIGHTSIGSLDLIGVQVTTLGAGLLIVVFILAVTVFNPTYRKMEHEDMRHGAKPSPALEPAAS